MQRDTIEIFYQFYSAKQHTDSAEKPKNEILQACKTLFQAEKVKVPFDQMKFLMFNGWSLNLVR